ncbi:MAG: hypothetical protein LBF97_06530 [Elusimicrobiota bacterium]|jgi:hypothetical protein|nr:hypothetical protein [Elusimicrobiota bacterium]
MIILNKITKKISIFMLVLLFFISSIFAAFNSDRYKSQNTRARGLGNSYTALSTDSGALLYNLGGLGKINYYDLYFLYTDLFADLEGVNIYSGYASFILPTEKIGTFGISYNTFKGDSIYYEDIVTLGYGKEILKNFNAGIGLSFLKHGYEVEYGNNIKDKDPVFEDSTSADNYGLSFGVLYDYNQYFSFGFSANNINKPDVGLKDEDIVPSDYRFGVAFKYNSFIIPIDIAYRDQEWGSTSDNKWTKSIGLEKWFSEMFAARVGFNDYEVSLGVSLIKPKIFKNIDTGIEYSLSLPMELQDTLGTHQVSLFFRFGNVKNFDKESKVIFYDYSELHPKFRIVQGISLNNESSSELLFDDISIYKFDTILNNQSAYDQSMELAKKLSYLIRTEYIQEKDLKIEKDNDQLFVNIKNILKIPVNNNINSNLDSSNTLDQNKEISNAEEVKGANVLNSSNTIINEDPSNLDLNANNATSNSLIRVEVEANVLLNKLKKILLIKENESANILQKNIGKYLKVRQAFTSAREVAVIYLKDIQIFTIYDKGKYASVFSNAVEFANNINKFLGFKDKSLINVHQEKVYGQYTIFVNRQPLLTINKEAEFLDVDIDKFVQYYIAKLTAIFTKFND